MAEVDLVTVGVARVEAPGYIIGGLLHTGWLPAAILGLALLLVDTDVTTVVFLVVADCARLAGYQDENSAQQYDFDHFPEDNNYNKVRVISKDIDRLFIGQ